MAGANDSRCDALQTETVGLRNNVQEMRLDIVRLQGKMDSIKAEVKELEKDIAAVADSRVSKIAFSPIQKIVYGIVGTILVAFLGTVISAVMPGSASVDLQVPAGIVRK